MLDKFKHHLENEQKRIQNSKRRCAFKICLLEAFLVHLSEFMHYKKVDKRVTGKFTYEHEDVCHARVYVVHQYFDRINFYWYDKVTQSHEQECLQLGVKSRGSGYGLDQVNEPYRPENIRDILQTQIDRYKEWMTDPDYMEEKREFYEEVSSICDTPQKERWLIGVDWRNVY